jgi:ketosteroid isomerase-like protein
MTSNTDRMQRTDDAWNTRDWDAFDTLHDPDCTVYWPGREGSPTHGGHDHRAEAEAFCAAFPDNHVKNEPYDILFGDGDFTCFVTRFTGTFTAPLKMADGTQIEPTGQAFDLLYSTAAHWKDGRIIEEFLFYDNGAFLQQIGLA